MSSTSTPRRVSIFMSRVMTVCSSACSASSVGAAASDELIAIARKHGFHAWAEPAAVLTELAPQTRSTPDQLRALNERLMDGRSSKSAKMIMCGILVDICAAADDVELARHVLAPLLDEPDTMHRAELLRLEGSLLLQCASPDPIAAEHSSHRAMEEAQGAKSFELRAATSLATLWRQQGKRQEARALLGGVYACFTEGFQTADLLQAKSLLDEWAVE
jgi:hypothetical protein